MLRRNDFVSNMEYSLLKYMSKNSLKYDIFDNTNISGLSVQISDTYTNIEHKNKK